MLLARKLLAETANQITWSSNLIVTTGTNPSSDIFIAGVCNIYYSRSILWFSYTSSEVQAATGATLGEIKGLSFDVSSEPLNQPLPDYAIGIKEGTFSPTAYAGGLGYTLVNGPASETFTVGTKKEFIFDTPFVWSGGGLAFNIAWGYVPDNGSGTNPTGNGSIFSERTDSTGTFVINTNYGSPREGVDSRPVLQLYI